MGGRRCCCCGGGGGGGGSVVGGGVGAEGEGEESPVAPPEEEDEEIDVGVGWGGEDWGLSRFDREGEGKGHVQNRGKMEAMLGAKERGVPIPVSWESLPGSAIEAGRGKSSAVTARG